MPEHVTHHWVKLDDPIVDLILTFDPEDLFDYGDDPYPLIHAYRKWAETIRQAVEDGLETA
jgi:hypothetical protein